MSIVSDLKTLYHLAVAPIRGDDHRQRLDSFYSGQARHYDRFRSHLLKGRKELYEQLPVPAGGTWLEMGGGTGHNLEYLGLRLAELGQVLILDLSGALLEIAQERIARHGWSNVQTRQEDVTALDLPAESVDVITFSYSLTMIPDWFAALENARRLLKPGGHIGVVDFYVARKYPQPGFQRHSWLTRSFWPVWLALDNVFPHPDHVPYLHRHFEPAFFGEERNRMRYFPIARVPYYRFVGRKPTADAT